MVIETALK
ncbi:hypothetical protein Zm00014a_014467 [Zea mays]|uniref:Uncharacterized protein n=1 Tax=Zea mays TaxID=4577 RepID=A0A3L6EUW8_MAIZE|nr:hypothetical protein Zm00014a_014467 [Zea mays]